MIRLNGRVVEQSHFPDGTLLMKVNPYKGEFKIDRSRSPIIIDWHYENDAELFTLICLKRHLDRLTNPSVVLYMPYIPHARMDRVKNDGDVFTLKYFCETINSLHFESIHVYDAHSNVSLALLNNVEQLNINGYIRSTSQFICDERGEYPVFYFPDEGAMKRYSENASGEPYAFGIKKRDWETGQIQGIQIQNEKVIQGRDILIVDDICSKGGTFYYSAKALKEAGAKNIYLYITHCENTILTGELLTSGLIERVYTTNSIFTKEHEMIEVFKL